MFSGGNLGLLGAYLMAAGTETTDPGASQRLLGQGLGAYSSALKGDRERADEREFKRMKYEEGQAEKRKKTEAANRARGMLYGPGGAWRNPDTGITDYSGGMLSRVPEDRRELIAGMARLDPMKGYEAAMGAMKPTERFETAQSPYGRGGVGQRSSTSGKISGYQAPKLPTTKKVWDAAQEKMRFATEAQIAQAGGTLTPVPSGMKIESDGKGGFTLVTGDMAVGGASMTKPTRTDIEKKLIAANEGLVRLQGIRARFKPEYQEIPTRFGVAWTGLKARFGNRDVPQNERKLLTDFSAYKRDAIANINLYIKEITGAQMSEAEADRLRLAVPDPGEGIFGGDDPISFKSNMDSLFRDLEKSQARFRYYLENGITDVETVARQSPLEGMKMAVDKDTGEPTHFLIDNQWVPI